MSRISLARKLQDWLEATGVAARGALIRNLDVRLRGTTEHDRAVALEHDLATAARAREEGQLQLHDFLVDGVNAYVSKPGDERSFADNMMAVLRDPCRATEVGAHGQRICIERMDYRSHIDGLAGYFVNCIEGRRQIRHSQDTDEDVGRPAGAHAPHCKAAGVEGI